jgi:hypothetical protein
MILILGILYSLFLREFIAEHIQNLQVFELYLLLWSLAKVAEELLERSNVVVANTKHIELRALLEPFEHTDVVIVQ